MGLAIRERIEDAGLTAVSLSRDVLPTGICPDGIDLTGRCQKQRKVHLCVRGTHHSARVYGQNIGELAAFGKRMDFGVHMISQCKIMNL